MKAMSYGGAFGSGAPISKVKTAYHCSESLASWSNLAVKGPSSYTPYQPNYSYSNNTNPTDEPRTRKNRPSPLKPYSSLPSTLQVGQSTRQPNSTTSTYFPYSPTDALSPARSRRSTTSSSSPCLHLTTHSAPPTPTKIDLFKPLPSIKIVPCVARKPVSPAPQSTSPDFLQPSTRPPSISPPSSPSPPLPSSSPLSPVSLLSSSPPSPKYGDARFHTLPEEAYPLIKVSWDISPTTATVTNDLPQKQHDNPLIVVEDAGELHGLEGMEEFERPFWRAAIQPVIDPRSGREYYR